MEYGFYHIVTMEIKYNWKSNLTVSFMETEKLAKSERDQQIIQLAYTRIVSKLTQENNKEVDEF